MGFKRPQVQLLSLGPKTQSVFPPAESMGYYAYWSFSERPKYSGTLCLSKHKPIQVHYGIGNEEFDREGRVITLSFGQFYLVNCYVPNSQSGVNRACFRMDWDVAFREYLCKLNEMKPVIVVGDFNVARSYIDIFPENLRNEEYPEGFLQEERDGMEQLLESGFVDTFRYLRPKTTGAYSWWSNRLNKRSENRGWRLDYCLCSVSLQDKIKNAGMYKDIYSSDHCPVYFRYFFTGGWDFR